MSSHRPGGKVRRSLTISLSCWLPDRQGRQRNVTIWLTVGRPHTQYRSGITGKQRRGWFR